MKKLLLATLTTLTLILTACSASSNMPQAGPANQDQTLPPATQLIVGTFKLDGTAQAVTAEQAKELLPLWQVYQDLSTSDTAAQEEKDGLVEQIQETMTAEQTQAITDMNLTQHDIFTLMQEKGLGGGGQRNNSNGGTSTGNGNNFPGAGGGFTPPDGGMPGGGFPSDGGFPGGNQSRNNGSSQNGTDTTTARPQMNAGTVLLEPLIELLKQKAGS